MNGENVAGYKNVVTGSTDATAGAAQIAAVSAPELKSLLGIAMTAMAVAALYFGLTQVIAT